MRPEYRRAGKGRSHIMVNKFVAGKNKRKRWKYERETEGTESGEMQFECVSSVKLLDYLIAWLSPEL